MVRAEPFRGKGEFVKHILLWCMGLVFLFGCSGEGEVPGEPAEEETADVIPWNGVDWRVGPDVDMDWQTAKDWVDSLGEDWRMPTVEELRALHASGITADSWGPFQNTGRWVWSGEEKDSVFVWHYEFDTGQGVWYYRSLDYRRRAFAVREP